MTPNRDDAAPSCPTLLIAAGASGQGKTSVTAALARLHARQGRRVRVFKCGPDFLDPHWLALASGAPGSVTMQTRLAALGPQQLLLNPQTAPNEVLRGHTFHYSRCETRLLAPTRTSRPGTPPEPDQGEALYQRGALRASYFHAWFASAPRAVAQLFGAESA